MHYTVTGNKVYYTYNIIYLSACVTQKFSYVCDKYFTNNWKTP